MELNFVVSENDYVQYNLFHYEHSKTIKRQRIVFGLLLIGILGALDFILKKRIDFSTILLITVFTIIWFVFGKILYRKILSYTVNKLMREGKANEFIGPRTLSLLDDKIRMVDTRRTIEISYDSVERIESDSERLYVYIGSISAFIIPFSAFENNTDKQAFINTIQQKANL